MHYLPALPFIYIYNAWETVANGSDLWLRSATVLVRGRRGGEHRRPQSATRSRFTQVLLKEV